MARRITDETRARIIELARTELSARSIAAEIGVSPSTVSKVCRNATPPIRFDRARTKAATDAKVEDDRARRTRIASGFLDDVERVRRQLFMNHNRAHFDPKTGKTTSYQTPLTPGELRDLAVAAGVMLDKHLSIAKIDSTDTNIAAVDQWIAEMLGTGE